MNYEERERKRNGEREREREKERENVYMYVYLIKKAKYESNINKCKNNSYKNYTIRKLLEKLVPIRRK